MSQASEASPGGFDSERAKKMAADVAGEYRRKLKFAQRWMLAELLVFTGFIMAGAMGFVFSNDAKLWAAYAVVFLVSCEATVLIKLWYFVTNTKLSIVRDIKALRLGSGAGSQDVGAEIPRAFSGISLGEWAVWICAFLVVMVGAGAGSYWLNSTISVLNEKDRRNVEFEQYVDLAADGSGKVITKTSAIGSTMPTDTYTVCFSGDEGEKVHWYDKDWRELPSEMKVVNGVRVYTIHWPHLMMSGDDQVYYQVLERANLVQKVDGVWRYEGQWEDEHPHAKWKVTVLMPPETQVVGTSPAPYESGGIAPPYRRFVGFDGIVNWNGDWSVPHEKAKWKLEYRMPAAPEAPTTQR